MFGWGKKVKKEEFAEYDVRKGLVKVTPKKGKATTFPLEGRLHTDYRLNGPSSIRILHRVIDVKTEFCDIVVTFGKNGFFRVGDYKLINADLVKTIELVDIESHIIKRKNN